VPTYRPAVLLSALALAVSLTACSSDDPSVASDPTKAPTSTGAPAAGGTTLTIENFAYSPATLTVAPGTTVSVTNRDGSQHDVDSDEDGLFKTKLLGKNETITFKAPTKAGSYSYICSVHPSMKGSLVVS
jgi:plastocyanin